jgi:hypothetical protein
MSSMICWTVASSRISSASGSASRKSVDAVSFTLLGCHACDCKHGDRQRSVYVAHARRTDIFAELQRPLPERARLLERIPLLPDLSHHIIRAHLGDAVAAPTRKLDARRKERE